MYLEIQQKKNKGGITDEEIETVRSHREYGHRFRSDDYVDFGRMITDEEI